MRTCPIILPTAPPSVPIVLVALHRGSEVLLGATVRWIFRCGAEVVVDGSENRALNLSQHHSSRPFAWPISTATPKSTTSSLMAITGIVQSSKRELEPLTREAALDTIGLAATLLFTHCQTTERTIVAAERYRADWRRARAS
jgi:hypothetical protein